MMYAKQGASPSQIMPEGATQHRNFMDCVDHLGESEKALLELKGRIANLANGIMGSCQELNEVESLKTCEDCILDRFYARHRGIEILVSQISQEIRRLESGFGIV